MKGDTLDLIITFFVEVRFGCCLGCISSIFIMKNDYTKFQHLKLSIERPHGQLFYNMQYVLHYVVHHWFRLVRLYVDNLFSVKKDCRIGMITS